MSRSFNPTAEQDAIVDAVRSGGGLKIKAYAGAGKTSTLRLVAGRPADKWGSYLAFNREIAEHARRGFPPNVVSRTMHSVAYASVGAALRSRLDLPSEQPHELAARYGLGAVELPSITGKALEITAFEVGRMIVDGLGRFCRSAQISPEASHVPVDEKVDEAAAQWLREALLPYVARLWEESIAPRSHQAIGPDVVLKVWAQSYPHLDVDFILFDEAQDSDGVMLSVLARQRHAQIIYVGDPYQQIYEWRGAINAMASIDAPEQALTPGSDSTLLCHRPLRTVRETFASYGSSPAEISHLRDRFIGKPSCPFIFASYCTCMILEAGAQNHH